MTDNMLNWISYVENKIYNSKQVVKKYLSFTSQYWLTYECTYVCISANYQHNFSDITIYSTK